MLTRFLVSLLATFCLACGTSKNMVQQTPAAENNILDSLLRSNPQLFGNILSAKDTLNVQVIYTRIDREANNKPSFNDYSFNLSDGHYFYPASTVKMPVALLALEKLNQMKVPGVNLHTAMVTDSNFSGQKQVITHAFSEDAKPSVAQYIKEIFLVSDNDAFNRLYEFLGQGHINERLHQKGYAGAEILHRLDIFLTEEENRHTNAVIFLDSSATAIHHQPAAYNTTRYSTRDTRSGKGFYRGGSLVKEPFNFSVKNRFYLRDLHQVLRSVIFPEAVPAHQRFDLTNEDYDFLYKSMSTYPRESNYPKYDTADHWDAYVKFLLYGSQKETLPANIRIFNKVGDAYGFLTDIAYVVDFDNKIEFMLSATILCNSDGIFNDDKYDYEEVGFPFMKNLGQVIYEYERRRKREYVPDLSKFTFKYDE
jgi:hypothetical protein